jgi:hypothetical protein
MPLFASIGFGFIKSFLKKYWKILLVVALAVAAFIFVQNKVHAYGERQFKAGVEATIKQVRTEVSKRDVVNRAIEDHAQRGLDEFATAETKKNDIRHAAEDKIAADIATTVDSVPMWNSKECAITPQVLADRNSIRALGPDAPKEDTK